MVGRCWNYTSSTFQSVTLLSIRSKEARRYLEKYKLLESAIDAYFSEGGLRRSGANLSTSSINTLFDRYKDSESDEITEDGTVRLCRDLGVDLEDVVLLAVAYELKSPHIGRWSKKGWVSGAEECDSLDSLRNALPRLRDKLASDPAYFVAVYNYTFQLAREEGQRSLALDAAIAYWELLIPFGLSGGALKHVSSSSSNVDIRRENNHCNDTDIDMEDEESDDDGNGWTEKHTEWWFEFLRVKGSKGVSKDTWQMLPEFIRTIDENFDQHDATAAWPSTIDDFVAWAKEKKLRA
ncbi:Cullin binding-domain-containing protein [Pisolithus croceorrhizus]|nr:Cullin binding-domain-containing protein [Pisolithus croceorrhizus]